MKLSIETIKLGLGTSFLTGFTLGMIPNKLSIKLNGKHNFFNINLPITCGCIGVLGLVSSPFLITNYFLNGTYFDRLYDKYDVNIKRYHQLDGNNNKYAFPSWIQIEINNKELEKNILN
jgi:hypothetical protein